MNVLEVKEAINVLKKNLKISKIVLPQYKLDEFGIKTLNESKNPAYVKELGYIETNKLNFLGISLESR